MAWRGIALGSVSFVLIIAVVCTHISSAENNLWPSDNFIERDLLTPLSQGDKKTVLIYLKLTLDALKKALIYIDTHIDVVNLDGIIGPRQTESQLAFLVGKYWPRLPPEISKQMKEIVIASSMVSEKGEKIVKKATPKYYANSYPLIKPHFFDNIFPSRAIDTSLIDVFTERTKEFSEKESDDCLTEFYGISGRAKCVISNRCWSIMVGRRQKEYSLTHEVFYLLNGIQANCLKEVTETAQKNNGTTPVQLLDYFCANVYKEALEIEKNGFEKGIRDLFMEQIGLCGDAGYIEIAQWRWLTLILKWQRPNGCYGLFEGEILDPRNLDPTRYGKYKRSVGTSVRRVKRSEQVMSSSGCLSHRVSVAISALNTYVRRLVGHYIGETI